MATNTGREISQLLGRFAALEHIVLLLVLTLGPEATKRVLVSTVFTTEDPKTNSLLEGKNADWSHGFSAQLKAFNELLTKYLGDNERGFIA